MDGSDLAASVADTGIGIPADRQDRVFGLFERVNEDRSEATGTGLGLALTKSLVEIHGGTIAFESEEGRGTTFRLRLPQVAAELVPGDRLLVVEDAPNDAELIVELARSAGLPCEVVGSATAALAALERGRPSGVVLDLRLPDARGERVIEALKRTRTTADVPLIVVSVEDDDGRVRQLGADDHLTKPIDAERLRLWLGRVGAQREGRVARAAG